MTTTRTNCNKNATNLCDCEANDLLPANDRRSDALLHFFGAERENGRQPDSMRHQRCADAAASRATELLRDDEVVENVVVIDRGPSVLARVVGCVDPSFIRFPKVARKRNNP